MDAIATIEQFAWIGWIVLIVLFLVIEMLSLEFTFLMIGVGSLAGLVSDFAGAPVWAQVIVAAVVSLILLVFLRPPLLRRLRRGGDDAKTNVDALTGLTGVAMLPISSTTGQAKLANGETWTARSPSSIATGARVRVERIDGATAIVVPTEQEL